MAESPVLARRLALTGVTWRGALFAAALPLLFLHVRYQPGVHVPVGSTRIGVEISDVAVLAAGLAALVEGVRRGFAPLRAALPAWIAAAALLAWIAIRTLVPFHLTHAVTAAKFAEYAIVAVAAPLLLRRRTDVSVVLGVAVAWGVAATAVALLQFFGTDIAAAWPPGRRQPSFLGHNDFAALSGMVLATGVAALLLEPVVSAPTAVAGLVAGGVGLILAGASAGAGAAVAGVVSLVLVALWRRSVRPASLAATAATIAAVVVGVVAFRAGDYDQFLRFVGVKQEQRSTREDVQSYAHHTLLAYVGWEIFRKHPAVGAGWQRANDPDVYRPALPAAHRKFPDVSPVSFPAPARPYGVQNAYVEVLADLGVVGIVLWLAFLGVPLVLGAATAVRAPAPQAALAALGTAWLLVAAVLWIPQNLVAGIPLDALTWLGIGAAATGAARA